VLVIWLVVPVKGRKMYVIIKRIIHLVVQMNDTSFQMLEPFNYLVIRRYML